MGKETQKTPRTRKPVDPVVAAYKKRTAAIAKVLTIVLSMDDADKDEVVKAIQKTQLAEPA